MVSYATPADVILALGMPFQMLLRNVSGSISEGDLITGGSSAATGRVISYDSIGKVLTYEWVSGTFTPGESLTIGSASATLVMSESALVQQLLSLAQDLVEEYTWTKWGDNTRTATEKLQTYAYDDEGGHDVYVRNVPLVAVSSITYKGTALVEGTDYWVFPDEDRISFKEGVISDSNPQDLVITYTWGNASVPGAIKQATVQIVVNAYNKYLNYKNLGGAYELRMADFVTRFDPPIFIDESIEKILHPYIYRRMGVAV